MKLMVIPTLGWTPSDVGAFIADVEAIASHFDANITTTIAIDHCIEIGGELTNRLEYAILSVTPDE